MSKTKLVIVLQSVLLAFAVAVSGQTTTGSMRGVVSDSSGGPVPGATVTITSAALIGQARTAYTTESGVFRFPSLPLGTYTVEVTMEGFETVHLENVQVSLNATANVPVVMKFSTQAESLTVIGETPIIDVTESSVSTSYQKEMLEDVPTQRQMTDLMQVSPGMSATYGDSYSTRTSAFGSNTQSNSWNIDGLEVSGPETGSAWWSVNADAIEEIQIIGVGAPAEYGNHTGAVFNVVTKKGSNDFHGSGKYFFNNNDLVGENVVVDGFSYNQEYFRDLVLQLGGPIKKDRVWFFGSYEYYRNANTQPGNDPAFTPVQKSDKYDIKVTARIGEKHQLSGLYHTESFAGLDPPSPFYQPSALSGETGNNPAWGATWTSTLTQNMLLEINYAGWWSDDLHDSQTGSFEEPFIDYTPPGGGTTYSGGVWYPWNYVTWREQLNGKATYYADDFLKSQHEFKFGVQFAKGSALTNVGIGPEGTYSYNYYGTIYQAVQAPYQYGGLNNDLGFFVDDTVTVNDMVTLNLGLRFDHNTGRIPDYKRLEIGEPSISEAGLFKETDETVPGVDVLDWNLVSPRLGVVIQPRRDGRSIISGSFGVYYDHNVSGNWDSPPPDRPDFSLYQFNPDTGQFDLLFTETPANFGINPDLKAPRTLQYAVGYQQQISDSMSVGVDYVYKDTKNLIGWEILGGLYEPVPFTDPFTGNQYTILSELEVPLRQKGNNPGDFPGSEGLRYFQKYQGVVLTFAKRFSDKWGLNASYTWSKSTGLIPRMLSQYQFNPFYSSREGSDPNNFINAEGRLQGDRPNMFRAQAVFYKLPWDIKVSGAMEFSSGRPHTRLIRVGDLGQGTAVAIMERDIPYPAIQNIDILVGKIFNLGSTFQIEVDGGFYNILNTDTIISFNTLELENTSDTFVPDVWYQPRRLQLQVGFQF